MRRAGRWTTTMRRSSLLLYAREYFYNENPKPPRKRFGSTSAVCASTSTSEFRDMKKKRFLRKSRRARHCSAAQLSPRSNSRGTSQPTASSRLPSAVARRDEAARSHAQQLVVNCCQPARSTPPRGPAPASGLPPAPHHRATGDTCIGATGSSRGRSKSTYCST